MKKAIYVIGKILKITTVFFIFIAAAFIGLIFPAVIGLYVLYVICVPFAFAVFVAVINITDWYELFSFHKYEYDNPNSN